MGATEKLTWLERRNRRKARERAADERVAEAVERVAMKRLSGELAKTFVSNGVGVVEPDRTETQRIKALIERDRKYQLREDARRLAEIEVEKGVFVSITDTVMEPTPEWMERGDVTKFWPKQHSGTSRAIATVRRVRKGIPDRLFDQGKLTQEQFAACKWYRDKYEEAGLEGRYKTAMLDSNGGGGATGGAQHPMPHHEFEAIAREEFRIARSAIKDHNLKMFDAVVLDDLPLRRAARFIRCDNSKILPRFRESCERLVGARDVIKRAKDLPAEGMD